MPSQAQGSEIRMVSGGVRVLSETGATVHVCVTAVRDRQGILMSFLLRHQADTAVPERRRGSFPLVLLSLELLLPEPILRNPTQRVCIIFLTLQSHALDRLGKISNILSPRILVAGLFSGTVSKVLVKDINYELLFFIRTK